MQKGATINQDILKRKLRNRKDYMNNEEFELESKVFKVPKL